MKRSFVIMLRPAQQRCDSDGVWLDRRRDHGTVRAAENGRRGCDPDALVLVEELAKLPRRSVTLLYDRFGKPFATTGAVQARMRDLMADKAVLADLVAREVVSEGQSLVFRGLRKNACCYLLKLGLNDSQVDSMLGMSPAMVRHYGKRSKALMIARGAADSVKGNNFEPAKVVNLKSAAKKSA